MIVIQKVQLNFIYINIRVYFRGNVVQSIMTHPVHLYLANRLQIKLFEFKRWQSNDQNICNAIERSWWRWFDVDDDNDDDDDIDGLNYFTIICSIIVEWISKN